MEQSFAKCADERELIIFGEPFNKKNYGGGIRSFDKLTVAQIKALKEASLIDEADAQNCAPTAGEMCDFLLEHDEDGWYAHGYTVSPEREDCRLTFEGVGKETTPSRQDIIDFIHSFKDADELRVEDNSLWCWYD